MADEELHYVEFDIQETWNQMMKIYLAAGGEPLYPGDEKEIYMRAVLAIATAIMSKVDSALRMDTLTYATGDYLKEYGLKRGCAFIEAVSAQATVTITFGMSGVSQTIPAGTQLTADGEMIWATGEDIEQTGLEQVASIGIVCQKAGTAGNALAIGTQMQFIGGVDGVSSVIVTAAGHGGVDAETEEAYRERIRNYGLSAVTTGPSEQYESAALAVSPYVIDAKALNDGAGAVGVYLIIDEEASAADVKSAVEAALSADDTRPLTDNVTVYEATEDEYTLNVKVWYSGYAGIAGAVTAAVEEYQSWQDNKIGRAFNPDKLMAMLYQAGCERVQFIDGSSGVDDDVEYTEIGQRERCKGTISVTAVTE